MGVSRRHTHHRRTLPKHPTEARGVTPQLEASCSFKIEKRTPLHFYDEAGERIMAWK
jgi:hypothetical protein